ncbi:MAG: HEAT repeat domain-containing protein [Planctomycetaceae bacterium]
MTAVVEVEAVGRQLESREAIVRIRARDQLVKDGSPEVVRMLISALYHRSAHLRWEAAKALADIGDPAASAAFLHAIDDDNCDVRWVACEGLVALGETGLVAVLFGLMRRAISPSFCRSAHHVLSELRCDAPDIINPVLAALNGSQPAVTAPVAAFEALRTLGY